MRQSLFSDEDQPAGQPHQLAGLAAASRVLLSALVLGGAALVVAVVALAVALLK
jgi:hypothetical protein